MTAIASAIFPAAATLVATALALVAATLFGAAFLATTAARSTTGLRDTLATSAASGSAHSLLHHLPHPRRRATLRTATAALGSAHAFLHHLPDVRRRATLHSTAADLSFVIAMLTFAACPIASALTYLLAMIPVTISILITSPAALISLCLFAIRMACGHSPHPDQQGGRHSNYLV